jgi:para-aminobenzoate synthetase component 1
LHAPADEVCRGQRRRHDSSLWLDGRGGFDQAWLCGPLLALDPRLRLRARRGEGAGVEAALRQLDRLVRKRRAAGGPPETGVAALCSYELFCDPLSGGIPALPDLVVWTVDGSLRWTGEDRGVVSLRGSPEVDPRRLVDALNGNAAKDSREAACALEAPRSSLPRQAYLAAVDRVQQHITRGDVYQANLCQRFEVGYTGDPFESFVGLTRSTPAPHSAFVETQDFALASVSPETFLRSRRPGEIETWPIKGTRPRGASIAEDRAAARQLERSDKDRAELLMIVDLERNDLSRACRAGTVEVPELAGLRSYSAVHHLVAQVRGTLKEGVGIDDLLHATFPGGSITGAPKLRAMRLLRELEPVPRGFFTGSLFWFGDDGSLDSSILIRSWVFGENRAWLGAGGGIVADSVAEAEWAESNHKARALAAVLGFDPEEAW